MRRWLHGAHDLFGVAAHRRDRVRPAERDRELLHARRLVRREAAADGPRRADQPVARQIARERELRAGRERGPPLLVRLAEDADGGRRALDLVEVATGALAVRAQDRELALELLRALEHVA